MKRFAVRASLAAALVVLAACGGGSDAPIYIGVAGPVKAANGRSMELAARLAVKEINAKGGINGRPLELVVMDDEANANKAMEVARTLRRDRRIVAVVGHVNSSASLKASEVYNAEGDSAGRPLLQISPASSSPALTQAGPWTFRVTPTDLEFSPVLARWAAQQLGKRRAAVLYVNDDYGQGVRQTFEQAFRRLGGSVVSADPYLNPVLETGTELDPYIMRAIARGADALVIGGQADGGVKIIAAARRLGYTGPILGSDGMTGAKDSPVAEGLFVSSAFLPDRPNPRSQAFVTAYRRENNNELPDHRGAMAYDVIYLLAQALREAGTDRQALRDYIASIGMEGGRPRFEEAVSGTIAFNADGDVVGKEVAVGVVRNRQLVTAGR
ncbi:MAG TPA: ABC transporter substrate-binding protein [Longimicrobium sp.]|nr:ABC transporter substrate-binding protein [Longimicrobium sp.]